MILTFCIKKSDSHPYTLWWVWTGWVMCMFWSQKCSAERHVKGTSHFWVPIGLGHRVKKQKQSTGLPRRLKNFISCRGQLPPNGDGNWLWIFRILIPLSTIHPPQLLFHYQYNPFLLWLCLLHSLQKHFHIPWSRYSLWLHCDPTLQQDIAMWGTAPHAMAPEEGNLHGQEVQHVLHRVCGLEIEGMRILECTIDHSSRQGKVQLLHLYPLWKKWE